MKPCREMMVGENHSGQSKNTPCSFLMKSKDVDSRYE